MIRALDLFCGAGGATRGLQLAGLHVTGVDNRPQPRYCGDRFIQADALEFDVRGFDLIWASPPCQKYSGSTRGHKKEYPDLVGAVRAKLEASGVPWVIENVPGAPLRSDAVLCGSHFGLRLVRHRVIEASFSLGLLPTCDHHENPVCVVGHSTPSWVRVRNSGRNFTLQERYQAMGIEWMDRDSLSLAIPPAYSKWIAGQFLTASSTPKAA
jgi:DNA (cytosine-5)-methyltransferase 1